MDKSIPILLEIDVEPDGHFLDPVLPGSWDGVEAGFEFLERLRSSLSDGWPARFVWLVRADPQIDQCYGGPDWGLRQYASDWQRLRGVGDELGVHVHSYLWDGVVGQWAVDFNGDDWTTHCLGMAVEAFHHHFHELPETYSIGMNWTSAGLRQHAADMGLQRELGVVAGRCAKPFPQHMGRFRGAPLDGSAVQSRPHKWQASEGHSGLWVVPVSSAPRQTTLRRKIIDSFSDRTKAIDTDRIMVRLGPRPYSRYLKSYLEQPDAHLVLTVRSSTLANPAARSGIEAFFASLKRCVGRHLRLVTAKELVELRG